jgi:hypothetical protein
MADPTEAQLKEAARKALAAGNTASAKRLIDAARKAAAATPAVPNGMTQDGATTRPVYKEDTLPGPATAAFADGDPRNPVAAPASVDDRNLVDSIMDGAGYLAQETTRGVTNMLGAPVDIVNSLPMLANVLPGVEGVGPMSPTPAGGGRMLNQVASLPKDVVEYAFDGQTYDDLTTDNPYLRVAGRAANEIGASMLPIGGAMLAAGNMGAQGARNMGGPIGDMIESAAVNPTTFGMKEAAVSGGAGAGAGIAREVVSDGDPTTVTPSEGIADLFGALLGGVTTQGTMLGLGAGRDMVGAITGGGGGSLVREIAADAIGEAAGVPKVDGVRDTGGLGTAIATGKRVGDTIPGFVESTGDVLKNSGVQALEYGRQSGPNAGTYAQRRTQNTEAVNMAIDDLAPEATPGAFREPLAVQRDAALGEAGATATAAQDAFDVAAQKLQTSMSGEARGQTIRGALDEALGAARTVEREAWSAVSGEADPAPLATAFEDVTNGLTMAERRAVSTLGEAVGTPGVLAGEGNVDLAEITSLRSELLTGVRQAKAAGDSNQVRIIEKYIQAIDGYMDGIPRLAEPLKAARDVSFDLNERFTRRGTPVADVMASRPSGGPVVPDSRVAPRFIAPDEGQASNIDRIMRESGNSADVQAALADEIKAGAQPLLNKPDQLDAYLKEYGAVFEKFPELKAELGTAAALRRSADTAAGAKAATDARLGPTGTSAVAKYLQYGDERAVDAMSGVVNAKDPKAAIDELMTFAGNDPQTVEGARSAFWELMKRDAKSSGSSTRTATGDQPWRPSSLYNFLKDPKRAAVAERLYTDNPEHLDNLKGIAEELRGVDLRSSAKAPNTSGTPQGLQGNQILPSAETLGAYGMAYQRGQVGAGFIGLRLASVMARRAQMIGRGREFQNVIDKALLDPDFAALLMKEYNPADAAAMARSAKAYLGTRSAWIDEALLGTDTGEDDDMKNTIMGDE